LIETPAAGDETPAVFFNLLTSQFKAIPGRKPEPDERCSSMLRCNIVLWSGFNAR
jgi:hypothetical protein